MMGANANNKIIVAMLVVVTLGVAFWMLLLSPKRDEVSKLETQVTHEEEELSVHQADVQKGLKAARAFPQEYQQLVVLGKAAPAEDETASLLVQLNLIAEDSHLRFQTFELESEGSEAPEETEAEEPAEGEPGSYPSPTEVAASTLPLGSSIGPAGLAVMPYKLTFEGSFFHLADFIHGLDSLVKSKNASVEVTGRLITISGFNLKANSTKGFPYLESEFTVTTYLVPPEQGVTGGASPTSPEPSTTPVSTTTGGTP